MALSTKARVLIAVSITLLLIAAYAFIFFLGFYVGVMGTDACHGVEGYAIVYLSFGWPAILLLAALTPGALILSKARSGIVVLAGILAGIFGLLAYLIYPLLLQFACRPI